MTELRRYSNAVRMYFMTIGRTVQALRGHRLGALVPLGVFMIGWAIVLWAINAVAPLAPFVYSLF